MTRRRQQKLNARIQDKLAFVVPQKEGERIRKLADKQNVSISKFLAEIVLAHIDEIEEEAGGD